MRIIKFRAKEVRGRWVEGDLIHYAGGTPMIMAKDAEDIIPESVGQYTGIEDKYGFEIYEGDIVEYWTIKSSTDVLSDKPYYCETERWLTQHIEKVVYNNGMFTVNNLPLCNAGLKMPVEDIRLSLGEDNIYDGNQDMNGVVICEDLRFLRVVGNVMDNPNMLENEE